MKERNNRRRDKEKGGKMEQKVKMGNVELSGKKREDGGKREEGRSSLASSLLPFLTQGERFSPLPVIQRYMDPHPRPPVLSGVRGKRRRRET